MKVTADERLLVADYRRGLVVVDPVSGSMKPLVERNRVEGFKGLNDLACAANGDIYFTDQGLTGLHDPTRRVFRLRPDRRLDLLVDNVPSPNGVVLDLNETALLVAVTHHCDIVETGNESWRFKNGL